MSDNTKKNLAYMQEAADAMRKLGTRFAKQVMGTDEAPSTGNVDEDIIYAFTNLHSNILTGYEKIEKLGILADKNEVDKDNIAINREFLMRLHEEDNQRAAEFIMKTPEFERDESIELFEGEVLIGDDSEDLQGFRDRRNKAKK